MKLLAKSVIVFLVMSLSGFASGAALFAWMVSAQTGTMGGAFFLPLASLGCGVGVAVLSGFLTCELLDRW